MESRRFFYCLSRACLFMMFFVSLFFNFKFGIGIFFFIIFLLGEAFFHGKVKDE